MRPRAATLLVCLSLVSVRGSPSPTTPSPEDVFEISSTTTKTVDGFLSQVAGMIERARDLGPKSFSDLVRSLPEPPTDCVSEISVTGPDSAVSVTSIFEVTAKIPGKVPMFSVQRAFEKFIDANKTLTKPAQILVVSFNRDSSSSNAYIYTPPSLQLPDPRGTGEARYRLISRLHFVPSSVSLALEILHEDGKSRRFQPEGSTGTDTTVVSAMYERL
jgi:hypothetical protein